MRHMYQSNSNLLSKKNQKQQTFLFQVVNCILLVWFYVERGKCLFEVYYTKLKPRESILNVYFMRRLLKIDTIVTGRLKIYNRIAQCLQKRIYVSIKTTSADASSRCYQGIQQVGTFYYFNRIVLNLYLNSASSNSIRLMIT